MFGNYEKKLFKDEKVWVQKYRNLNNALHWHDEAELVYIDQGNALIRIDENEYEAKTGDIYLIEGEKLHYIHAEKNTIVTVFQADTSLTVPFLDISIKNPKIDAKINMADYYEKINEALLRKKTFDTLYMNSLTVAMFSEVYNCPTVKKEKKEKHKEKFKDILKYMEENYASVTFDEICTHFYYSDAHFSRLFKTITSQTFTEYLTKLRIEKAIELIRENDKTITEIAESTGFQTIRNFNRCFKKLTGYTPSMLPKEYSFSKDIYGYVAFDPTSKDSEPIQK